MLHEYNIGEILQTLRMNKEISIEDLTKNICSVEEYEQFEKESAYPTVDQLYLLGQRLQVNLMYFFSMAKKSNQNYSQLIIKLIDKYKKERDYKTIHQIVLKEQKSPVFENVQLKQYLKWHEGICIYYLHNDVQTAISILENAIKLTNPNMGDLTESELEILTSIAMIIYETKNYKEASLNFQRALDNLKSLPTIVDPKVKIRILFGYAQSLTGEEEYLLSLDFCKQGIDICIEEELMYLFAELLYQTGENYIKFGDRNLGRKYVKHSIYICELTKQEKLAQIMKSELARMENVSN
ncbi:transcriptional regulator with XRE-family HTH domain [Cytobacillus horneckiae]|uniref:Transcriptional regulator n=1 Tax=Cytobacillus horneckiae TaxID=549687 RepID=A0A2N0ZLP7_9BACI|nr:transcriptional regulator [Cytobacillus horneckiae]MBN6885864.1 transcriptional regulator [Cytobacillus horneckiae]MCM3177408.1 transcriptional regulator [Cytobacillus horneckiae]MEC1156028.1 transcriptional regulator [Cytobacillus horneckiae]MED2937388.1 transcriptional regulator [Cytobacillus horneckiae]PKG30427.1 transcriptional regulator [Cytobacillus horneckiae]